MPAPKRKKSEEKAEAEAAGDADLLGADDKSASGKA